VRVTWWRKAGPSWSGLAGRGATGGLGPMPIDLIRR